MKKQLLDTSSYAALAKQLEGVSIGISLTNERIINPELQDMIDSAYTRLRNEGYSEQEARHMANQLLMESGISY